MKILALSLLLLTELQGPKDYQSLLRYDESTQSSYVKFTVDLQDNQKVYFQNSSLFSFHIDFLHAEVERFKGRVFRQEEIMWGPGKEISAGAIYWAGELNLPNSAEKGLMGFMIYPENDDPAKLDLDEVALVHKRLGETAPYAAKKLVYLFPQAKSFLTMKGKLQEKGIPSLLFSKFVGQGDRPVVYNPGESYGYLKAMTAGEFAQADLNAKDIVILDQVPLDIGPMSGIITSELQVPHSHVIFRAVNQKIPDLYWPNAQSALKDKIGKLVRLTASADNKVLVEDASTIPDIEARAEEYFKNRVPVLPELKSDSESQDFLVWKDASLDRSLVSRFGTKGTNFAVIDQAERAAGIDRSIYEGGFLVPAYYYKKHLEQSISPALCEKAKKSCKKQFDADLCDNAAHSCQGTLDSYLSQLSREAPELMKQAKLRKARLLFTQKLIENAPLDSAFTQKLKDTIRLNYADDVRMRFRSSTNAEDLPGLNGAGFYVSKAAFLDERLKKPVEEAVREVFASIWTEKAFLNRDYYRLDHKKVMMSILVHPSYVDETANGVLIATKTAEGNLELSVVAQKGDMAVTNPEVPGAIAEQLLFTRKADGSQSEVKTITRSNQTGGQALLSGEQIRQLGEQVWIACEALRAFYGPDYGLRMDIEFKVDGNGLVHMKQGRPL